MSTLEYYFTQIQRLLSQEHIMIHTIRDTTTTPMRWISCGLCMDQCFRSRGHSIGPKMTEICNHCREMLFKQLLRYYITKIEKIRIQECKKRIHEQLLEFCFHPEYIFKTGYLETVHLFADK
jgi:hypothetical protein